MEGELTNGVIDVPQEPSTSAEDFDEPFRPRTVSLMLNRIVDAEFKRSFIHRRLSVSSQDPTIERKYQELTRYLEKGSNEFENRQENNGPKSVSKTGRTKEILNYLSPKYLEKYHILVRRFEQWKPKRQELIRNLSDHINSLDRNFKISTIVRFVASSVDASGSVGGLVFRSESGWANHALTAASVCGLMGLVSTVAEVETSKRILDEISHLMENDLKLLEPIAKWFEDTEELDSFVQDVFPHGIDREVIHEIQEYSQEQDAYLKVFKAALMSNVRKDTRLLVDKDFLFSLQMFARSELAALWWNRIIYRRHPIMLDMSRMALQIEFGQLQSIIFQCIPALPLEQQRLTSLPVAGRVMLNLLTMYDAFSDLRKGAKSTHSDKLKRQLEKMTEELDVIEGTIRWMRPQGNFSSADANYL